MPEIQRLHVAPSRIHAGSGAITSRSAVAGLVALTSFAAMMPTTGIAQAPPQWTAFTQVFQAYVDSDHVVGASVVLMEHGRVIARYDAGDADRTAKVPVDPETIFHWGSITKSLTAISIMQLRDRGKLTLDDRIVRWVPELRQVHDPYGMIDSITIRMLLSHTAGFRIPHGRGGTTSPGSRSSRRRGTSSWR